MTIASLLYLLPILALFFCMKEDVLERKVSPGALACLFASYIPLAVYQFECGIYNLAFFWLFAAPQIVVWLILLIYGAITGRGGADRIVILTGAFTMWGFFAMFWGFLIWGLCEIVNKSRDITVEKFPYILPYTLVYVFVIVMIV